MSAQPLFIRKPRQVELTETGRALATGASEALRILAESYEQARTGGEGTLSISTIPTFAANWFALHLGSFQIAHPSIAVRLDTSNRMVNLAQDNIDIGIRTGYKGVWPGLVSHRLFLADFTPMLSPSLAATIGGVTEPADLLKLPIMDAGDPWWAMWFELAGIESREDLGGQNAQPARLAGVRGTCRGRRRRRRHPDQGAVCAGTRQWQPDPALRHRRQ